MRKTITLLIALLALSVSSWATQIEWGSTELANLNLSMGYPETETKEINGVTVSLSYQDSYNDNCYFNSNGFSMKNDGALVFASESGILTRIVIARTYEETSYPFVEGSGWELDSDNPKLLVWTGSAFSVPLKFNSSENLFSGPISSIVFTLSGTVITWESNDLESVKVGMENGATIENANSSQEVNGITITANAPAGSNSSNFSTADGYTNLSVFGEGSLTFAPASGKLAKIVITCGDASDVQYINNGDGWLWDETNKKLTWKGDAASVVLTAPSYGCGFMNISSVKFIVVASSDPDPEPEPDPALSGPSFIWQERQVSHVDLSDNATSPVIKNIILMRTDNTGSCSFSGRHLSITNDASLTFQSIVGDIRGIIITCDPLNDVGASGIQPSEDWTYDSDAKTFTWTGTPSDGVTISGNVDFLISSIEFFYTPADAPRKGETFRDEWQWYEITGLHTAKVIGPCNSSGGINIPASAEYDYVTYYINEIDDYAFYNHSQMSNAFIGENIARIGAHALDGCTWMAEITVNSHVLETIGEAAFRNCLLLQDIQIFTELPPVLGSNAFEGDSRLKHIHVYTTYAYKATSGWSAHEDVIGALYSNPALGEEFFYHNQMTTGIYEVTSVSPTKEAKVLPYSDEVNAIYPITYESTLVIPESPDYIHYGYSVTAIGANAFKDITDFKAVSIPKSVKSIEEGAFSGCTSVENVFFLWDDPRGIVTWADANVGNEFKTASGNTKIFVPAGTLAAYKEWAPAWESCMYESAFEDVTASDDPHDVVYYRTYYDSSHDLMLPPDVWAYVGYVNGDEFILRPIAFDGEIVPAGTAVVLRSFSQTYRLIMMDPEAQPYTGTNQLRGSDVNITIATDPELSSKADKIYVLGKEGWVNSQRKEGMGLYRYTGSTLGAHKAYMILENVSSGSSGQQNAPARFLFRYENTATGIENASASFGESEKRLENGQLIIIKNGVRYNAQGQIVK